MGALMCFTRKFPLQLTQYLFWHIFVALKCLLWCVRVMNTDRPSLKVPLKFTAICSLRFAFYCMSECASFYVPTNKWELMRTVSPEQAVNSKALNEEVCEASKTRACARGSWSGIQGIACLMLRLKRHTFLSSTWSSEMRTVHFPIDQRTEKLSF